MTTCEICDKRFSDMQDIEECSTCGSFVCVNCVLDDIGLEVYCSEECID